MSDDVDHKKSLRDVFSLVFKENRWGNEESVSGSGSALSSPSVRASLVALDAIIRRFNIKSISDVPCGDFYWFPLILGRFPRVEYHGFDIVDELIEWNRQRFPDHTFNTADVTVDVLPQADLIFCKDLLLHLKNESISHTLRNFKRSGSRFLLISSNEGVENEELIMNEPGAHRSVNLHVSPFDMPTPLWHTNYLSLWSLDAIDPEFFDSLCQKFGG